MSDEILELELLVVNDRAGSITVDGVVARSFQVANGRIVPDGQPFTIEVRPADVDDVPSVMATLRGWTADVAPVVVGTAMSGDEMVLVMAGVSEALVLRLG